MPKTYAVWIHIEEHDDETDEYTEMDAPGASVAGFEDYDAAFTFAARLHVAGEELDAVLPRERELLSGGGSDENRLQRKGRRS